MPFNGNGTFNLVAGNPVTTGTTISSTWANNTLPDIASGLTNALTKDGQTAATADLPMGGYKLTNLGTGSNDTDSVSYVQVKNVVNVTSQSNEWTALQTFNGSSSDLAAMFKNAGESINIVASAATGSLNFDVIGNSIVWYTTSATSDFSINFRGNSSISLNNTLATGQSITVSFMASQGATAFYNNAITIDGVSITPKYQNNLVWSSGFADSIDVYLYTIIKTGNASYTVLASQTTFK